jgi:hypothetical protein
MKNRDLWEVNRTSAPPLSGISPANPNDRVVSLKTTAETMMIVVPIKGPI